MVMKGFSCSFPHHRNTTCVGSYALGELAGSVHECSSALPTSYRSIKNIEGKAQQRSSNSRTCVPRFTILHTLHPDFKAAVGDFMSIGHEARRGDQLAPQHSVIQAVIQSFVGTFLISLSSHSHTPPVWTIDSMPPYPCCVSNQLWDKIFVQIIVLWFFYSP
jgi:hypothetical protein